MNEYDPTSPHEGLPARPVSSAASGPPVAGSSGDAGAPPPTPSPDVSASATIAKQPRWSRLWQLLSNRMSGWIVAGALMLAVIGLSIGLATSPSATANPAVPGGGFAGGSGSGGSNAQSGPPAGGPAGGGGGSNARSGPAAGGTSGTVDSVSTPSFTVATAGGQKVTINEASSTTYQNGTSSTSASAITTGESVLVLGTTDGTTITATQVTVQPTGDGGSAASSAAGVVPFQKGAPTTAKQVGQIPNYTEGQGTIVSGTAANKATEAALAAYPGGVVDRVVQLSNGEYEVHNIGVNWPHHVFVDQNFKVVGAN
jgi:hypothetical protein